jgi:hypothetical protein
MGTKSIIDHGKTKKIMAMYMPILGAPYPNAEYFFTKMWLAESTCDLHLHIIIDLEFLYIYKKTVYAIVYSAVMGPHEIWFIKFQYLVQYKNTVNEFSFFQNKNLACSYNPAAVRKLKKWTFVF